MQRFHLNSGAVALATALLFSSAPLAAQQPARKPSPAEAQRPSAKVPTAEKPPWERPLPAGFAGNATGVPPQVMLRIIEAEDLRRYDAALEALLADADPHVRAWAAMAAGRIGDEVAVRPLARLMREDAEIQVRIAAAFALGEIESEPAARELIDVQRGTPDPALRARMIEGIGKCAAAIQKADDLLKKLANEAVLGALEQQRKLPQPERGVVLAALTATLRLRPPNAGRAVAMFLYSPDARIRADAANALARLRLKDANEALRNMLANDTDAVARANAARALGAAEDSGARDLLLHAATADGDSRVRVSAVRSLGGLKDSAVAAPLLDRARALYAEVRGERRRSGGCPTQQNEIVEIVSVLGRLLKATKHEAAWDWLSAYTFELDSCMAPERDVAMAAIDPERYARLQKLTDKELLQGSAGFSRFAWRLLAIRAAGLGEVAAARGAVADEEFERAAVSAQKELRDMLAAGPEPVLPDALRALAAFKPADMNELLREQILRPSVQVRATAAELLGEQPPNPENQVALRAALGRAVLDTDPDAALAILNALSKQKTPGAMNSIRSALEAKDYLVRWRAGSLLRAVGETNFDAKTQAVNSRNTPADYQRAVARMRMPVYAAVATDKGQFVIELLPVQAPLTVDNFIRLAERKYFDGIVFHRVVPNFVAQTGDPTGTGSGGPGYAMRCEINSVPYERGAVGMALSGKDTGGSQWFVTHSPQPHLDGGYTVFGRVVQGMEVVDAIVRGDRILSVTIHEARAARRPDSKPKSAATAPNPPGAARPPAKPAKPN